MIDPRLLGEWLAAGFTYAIRPDPLEATADALQWLGEHDKPFQLGSGGAVLTVWDTEFTRVAGEAASIVGHWRDAQGRQEVYFRSDGRYLVLSDGEPVPSFGTFQVAGQRLSTWEFRTRVTTFGNQIHYCGLNGVRSVGTYVVKEHGKVFVVEMAGGPFVYTKVPSPSGS